MRFLLILVAVILGGLGWYYFYPPNALERRTEKALMQFDADMVPGQKANTRPLLEALLADPAAIRLEVSFFSPVQGANLPAVTQDFDKASFITFIDNVLYPLEDYSFSSLLREFHLNADHKSATIAFVSKEWADGASLYGGVSVNVRYSADTDCSGEVVFDDKSVRLSKLNCKLTLRTVPKPGEEAKFHNMETMQDLLKH